MADGSDFMRLLALDAEGEEAATSSLTDLGLDSISSIDLLGFGMCLFLTLFAFKVRSFPFAVVASIGWLIVGFQVASNSGAVIIFLLTFAIAAIQLVYGSKYKGW